MWRTYNASSSDLQINADPAFGCQDEGFAFDDPECDAVAGTSPTGGRGVSDYMLVEGNFFHGSDDGAPYSPNATELRETSFDPAWFVAFPTSLGHDPAAFKPSASAPWLDLGDLLSEGPRDLDGAARTEPTDLGPYER